RCLELDTDVDAIYDVLDAAVTEHGTRWDEQVSALSQQVLDFVLSGAQEHVEQPASALAGEALAGLEKETNELGSVLEAGADLAGELGLLSDELARCQTVMVQI